MRKTKRFLTMVLAWVMLLGAMITFAPKTEAAITREKITTIHCIKCMAYLYDYGDHYYCKNCHYTEPKS